MLHYVDEVATSNLGSRATGEQGRRRGVGVFFLFLLLFFRSSGKGSVYVYMYRLNELLSIYVVLVSGYLGWGFSVFSLLYCVDG